MRILKRINNMCPLNRIHELQDINGHIKDNKNDLINITESFYNTLFSENNPNPHNTANKKILNVGSEELLETSAQEVELALPHTSTNRAPRHDAFSNMMMINDKIGRKTSILTIKLAKKIENNAEIHRKIDAGTQFWKPHTKRRNQKEN